MKMRHILLTITALITMGCSTAEEEWISLFNGRNLDGWIVKTKGYPAGENPWNVFRVEDGMLTVSYDDFEGSFKNDFGHIFIDRPFTNYHFRCEYRFIGEQITGGPDWAYANSGAMLSGQNPTTMTKDQGFPTSIEFQFLAQDKTGERKTGSICTPDTYVDVNGETVMEHVIKSSYAALPLGEWVVAEAIVNDGKIRHIINSETAIEYSNPTYDDGSPVTHGWISLQAESHPVQFRNIEIRDLD